MPTAVAESRQLKFDQVGERRLDRRVDSIDVIGLDPQPVAATTIAATKALNMVANRRALTSIVRCLAVAASVRDRQAADEIELLLTSVA
jgi:hypothetical protein